MAEARPGLRVMVDANILIAGSVWPRWPHEVLRHAIAADFRLVLSPYVIAQAQRRLGISFPDNAWRLNHILELTGYEEAKNPAKRQVEESSGLVRYPTDLPIALAAINAKVDHLVSEDKDFTAQDETTAELRTRLSVLLSGTFLREVMGWSSGRLEAVRGRTWADLEGTETA